MRLREFNAEIRKGNVLLLCCLGKNKNGEQHCCGMIRVPFKPTIGEAPLAMTNTDGGYWERVSGETVDDLTLKRSINAGKCGHFSIANGEVTIAAQESSE